MLTSRHHRSATHPAGFSLLEVLIALVIAGIAFVPMFQTAAESMNATTTAARYQEAIARAQSHLDATVVGLRPGDTEGDDGGGFRWRVSMRATDSTGKLDAAGRAVPNTDRLIVSLYAVTVRISWRDGLQSRSVRLDSKRLLTSAPG